MTGRGLIDLHTHSTASDGSLSPSGLAEAAALAGLMAVALTDHDTVEGLPEFMNAGRGTGLTAIGGVEISLEHEATFHLLGYDVSGGDSVPSELERLKTFRQERNLIMLDRLDGLGYHIDRTRLAELSGGGQTGRPHLAAALVEKGYFNDRQEVFDRLLAKGRPGYVDKARLSPKDGLAMVRAAGWAPVLAHPASLNLAPQDWPPFAAGLKDLGLVGIEVFHPSLGEEESRFFLKLAEDLKLTATGGSDFHGEAKPAIHLSWTRRHSPLGLEVIDRLKEAL